MAISNADHDRRARLLAKSQSTLDDIDNVVDNKPLPRNEAVEASLTKQWGPDVDPIDPDHPTIFRFSTGWHPQVNGDYYRSEKEEGSESEPYLLHHNDRSSRIDMFGSTRFTLYRRNEIYLDEDGPLHGIARPLHENSTELGGGHEQRDHMYMSREDKQQYRDAHNVSVNGQINSPSRYTSSRSDARTSPARSRTLNRFPTGSQRLPIREAAQRAVEGNHARAGGRGTGDFSFRTAPEVNTVGQMDDADWRHMNTSNPNHVIYSYSTPIAWSEGEGENRVWTVPHKKHSRTTSAHQSAIRSALWKRGFTPTHETPGIATYRRSE